MIKKSHLHAILGRCHLGRVLRRIPEEQNTLLPGFFIVLLQKTIGPDIPIQDIDVGIRVIFTDMQRILYGVLAAYT